MKITLILLLLHILIIIKINFMNINLIFIIKKYRFN